MSTPSNVDVRPPGSVQRTRRELPAWLWLWLPPLVLVAQLAVRWLDRDVYLRWVEGERGILENATALILVPAVVAGLLAFRRRRLLPSRWLAGWLLLIVLGCVYFAGEELSWGQHWLNWTTPDFIQRLNDQQETNLHNTTSWLDQKPRLLLELGVLVGGVVLCLRNRVQGIVYEPGGDWRAWFWPTWVAFPSALLAILVRLPERIGDLLSVQVSIPLIRYSEAQEFFFALFLLLYLLSIHRRLRSLASSKPVGNG